jgi:Dna[CI] antecedent, DciA
MESVGYGLHKLFRDLLARVPADEAPLVAWPAVCGSAVAARTRALEFSDGVLRVEVPDPAWRAQLIELAPRYVAALSDMPGKRVSRIEFMLAGPSQETRR